MDKTQVLERLDKVMQVEATVPSKGNFMLTHVPFANLYLGTNPISENDLLSNYLLAKPEKHKLIMVQGDNGSGKSHLIRWLYEKYRENVDLASEKVMLISRAHNTLQDTLMQLLNSDIFPDEIKKNELEKIKNAQSAISGTELRKTVNFNFTLVIEDDVEKRVSDTELPSAYLPLLSEYLKNTYILSEFMMKSGGPLDRICAKLNNVDNESTSEYDGDVFSAKDFDITLDQIKKYLDNNSDTAASKQTINFARKLYQSGDFRERTASYMNAKVDAVIQKSLKLNTADFQKLFSSLRIQLKKQGMRLSLFVEDINAFTGIDLALMEVLLANHEAQGNEEYCRICSVVGSTVDFYRNRLNESIKERVQQNGAAVFIREESLFGTGDGEELVRFAAKYINACYLTDDQVEKWEENGCDEYSMPIADIDYPFSKVECFGNKMTIFPFNTNAIVKMYSRLNQQSKTPRRFLLDVIYPIVSHYYVDSDSFLQKESDYKNDSIDSLPDFRTRDDEVIHNRIGGDDKDRRGLLIRIWGDGTVRVKGETLGGLGKDVFEAFGINMLLDEYQKAAGADSDRFDDDVDIPVAEPIIDVVPRKKKRENQTEQEKIEVAIGEWLKTKSKAFANDLEMRGLISKFIYGNMNWDAEEIPRKIVETYVGETNKYISIEGNKNINESGIILEKTEESQELFYALVKYKYEGGNSWDFDGGHEWYRIASTWLYKHKREIIQMMSAPYSSKSYDEILIWALYLYKTFNGGFELRDADIDTVIDLFEDNFEEAGRHCKDWNDIKEEINAIEAPQKYLSSVLSYFSNSIGVAEAGETKYTFVDAAKVFEAVSKIKADQWNIKHCVEKGIDLKKNDIWTRPLKVMMAAIKNVDSAVEEEVRLAKEYKKYFAAKIGDYDDVKNVETVFVKIQDYLNYIVQHNLGYTTNRINEVKELRNARRLARSLSEIDKLEKEESTAAILSRLSMDPFECTALIYQEFKYIDELINEKNNNFKSKIDTDANKEIEKCRNDILLNLSRLIQIGNTEGGRK